MGIVNYAEIQRRRKLKKLTLAEAAKRAGWSSQRWNNVEKGQSGNGDIRISTLAIVAKVLGCKVDALLRK